MKKTISFLLSILMIFSLMAPTSVLAAEEVYEKIPMIYIRGNGATMYTSDGEEIYTGFEALGAGGEESTLTKEKIIETAVNILLPMLAGGMLADEWEAYGDALYEELAPLWEKVRLDGNGNPQYDTGVSRSELNWSENVRAHQDTGTDGWYDLYDYSFIYDWRLSPYDHVDRLHAFIGKIMAATKSEKVCIVSKCMGGTLLNAYLEKYGHLGHVRRVFYGDTLSEGCAFISDTFSGKVIPNDKAIQTFLKQAEYIGELDNGGVGFVLSEFASELVGRTVDLLTQTGVTDTLLNGIVDLYDRLYQEFIPALVMAAGLATYPNYWACVYNEDLDTALNLVFGKEGSQERKDNAGLIEKINYYHEHVASDLPGLYEKIKSYGIEVGVLSKYGYVDAPYTTYCEEPSDALVGVTDSSLGATASTIFSTLSDEYIKSRIEKGYGAYISPDKMIDASTCAFPETTWILKNAHHNDNKCFDYLAAYFCRYSNVTVNSNNRNISRFTVLDNSTESTMVNMTEENMAGFDWMNIAEQKPTTETKLAALMRWLSTFFSFLTKLIKGEINFGELFG